MIIELLLNLIKALLLLVIGLFPTLPNMSSLGQPLNAVADVLLLIDSFVSVRLTATCIGFLFVFTHIDFIWSIIMWVVKKIPGVS